MGLGSTDAGLVLPAAKRWDDEASAWLLAGERAWAGGQ